jgi:nicotinate-nucleotide adenylyltransferase
MRIGLFFGSFNPIHIGHLIIANSIINLTDVKRVWFIVSPQNPLKEKATLLNEYDRLHLVNKAIENNIKFKASSIEFKLPKPSYTIDTLTYLKEQYPQHQFVLIMGTDNLVTLPKWKNVDLILNHYQIIAYKRITDKHVDEKLLTHKNITTLDVPTLNLSATLIRQLIKQKKSIQYLVPEIVMEEIEKNNYYK